MEFMDFMIVVSFQLVVVVCIILIKYLRIQIRNAKKLQKIIDNDLRKTLREVNVSIENLNKSLTEINESETSLKETIDNASVISKNVAEITSRTNDLVNFNLKIKKNLMKNLDFVVKGTNLFKKINLRK